MFDRWIEKGLLDALDEEGIGCIAFSPLDQGILTDKYLRDIPEGFAPPISLAANSTGATKSAKRVSPRCAS